MERDGHKRQCVAKLTDGSRRCRKFAIRGGLVCTSHGGSAPQVQEAAQRRLADLVDPAIRELSRILDDPDASDRDKLRAVAETLDRTGHPRGAQVDVTVDQLADRIARLAAADDAGP